MGTWSVPIEEIAIRAQGRIDTVVRKITLDLFRDVVLRSPVDTGRFRANWNVSFGQPDYSTTQSTSSARGQAEALRSLTLPVGGIVWLSNGLPYVQRLEYGYSKQAPQGMVRLALQSARKTVARLK